MTHPEYLMVYSMFKDVSTTNMVFAIVLAYMVFAIRLDICVQLCAHICCVSLVCLLIGKCGKNVLAHAENIKQQATKEGTEKGKRERERNLRRVGTLEQGILPGS